MQVQQVDLILQDCHAIVLPVGYFTFTVDLSQEVSKRLFLPHGPQNLRFTVLQYKLRGKIMLQ